MCEGKTRSQSCFVIYVSSPPAQLLGNTSSPLPQGQQLLDGFSSPMTEPPDFHSLPHQSNPPRGAARLSFTARIEGAHADRAASASKKDGRAAPLPPF